MLVPRVLCPRCRRPERVCWCAGVQPLQIRTRVVVLQHPHERRVRVGTAGIVRVCLPEARLLVGVDFEGRPDFELALGDPAAPPVLLFPGPHARDLHELRGERRSTLVMIDGTWADARQVFNRNPRLATLPRYRLPPGEESRYHIRREPSPECVSTVEALARALRVIEDEPELFDRLLNPFHRLVEGQLAFVEQRASAPSRHRRRWDAANKAPCLPDLLLRRREDLVCLMIEADDPSQRRGDGEAKELVHCVAARLVTGERFEAVVVPRRTLSPSFCLRSGICPTRIEQGMSLALFLERWRQFLRAGEVLVGWGTQGFDLLARERCALSAERLDLRKVSGDLRRASPLSLERTVTERGLVFSPAGEGRAGIRLGMLMAMTRSLCDQVHRRTPGAPPP